VVPGVGKPKKMEAEEKVCPRCAETVKAAALVCRFCNYQFGTAIQTPPRVTTPQSDKRFLIGGGFVILVLAAILIGIVGSIYRSPSSNDTTPGDQGQSTSSDDSNTASTAPSTPAIQVTAVQLAEAYNANEVSAQNKFGNHTLDVTGSVVAVRLGLMDTPTLHLEAINEFMPVQATFDNASKDTLSKLSKGQTVTIRCTSITNVISTPMLSDCTFPEAATQDQTANSDSSAAGSANAQTSTDNSGGAQGAQPGNSTTPSAPEQPAQDEAATTNQLSQPSADSNSGVTQGSNNAQNEESSSAQTPPQAGVNGATTPNSAGGTETGGQTSAGEGAATFDQGHSDRQAWETWIAGLAGGYKDGALYWSSQRSLKVPGSCFDANNNTRGDFTDGCLEAQRRIAPSDARRKASPDYRKGWNTY
jgi:hypothetical protein